MKYRLAAALLLCISPVFAQKTGWQLVRENNWTAARAAFDEQLRANPTDETVLAGRLFLQETVQDFDGYRETANDLIRSWKPEMVALFGHVFDGDASEVASRPGMPENIRIPFSLGVADSFFYNRKFDEHRRQLAATAQDLNWSVVGPFPDESGAGHVVAYGPEATAFDEKQTFFGQNKLELNWLPIRKRVPDGFCSFERLATPSGLSTDYATTFVQFPESREVQFRIRRVAPMRVWVDGFLVADLPEPASGRWDIEILTLKIAAGVHQVLVKSSQFPAGSPDFKLMLEFNDHRDDGDGEYDNWDDGQSTPPDGFALRITDLDGHFIPIKSEFSGKVQPTAAAPVVRLESHPILEIFKKRASSTGDAQLSSLWLLSKMFLKYEKLDEGEAFFAEKLAAEPSSTFLKFITAKFFRENGKGERAEQLLSELDPTATPTFAWELKKVNDIDSEQREAEFQAGLERLLSLSPSHWPTMHRYLDFLKEKGRREVIEPFVRREIAAHRGDKTWAERLEEYLKADSYRPETEKDLTDREREKQFKSAQKLLKKRFEPSAYDVLIDHFKQKDMDGDVLRTYDELMAVEPWQPSWAFERARFLFEKNRLDDALSALRSLSADEPYSAEIFELMGDIFLEKKDKARAADFYKQAKKWGGSYQYGLREKLEKIENRRRFNQYFEQVDLERAARDTSWKAGFREEDSVIGLFSSQNWLNDDGEIESQTRMVIHIQTEAGARMWTEGDFRLIGRVTSAKVIKPSGAVSSPEMGMGGVAVFKNLAPGDAIALEGSNLQPMPGDGEGEFLMLEVMPFRVPVVAASLDLLLPKDTLPLFACNRLGCEPTVADVGEGLKKFSFSWKNIPKTDETEGATADNLDRFPWIMASTARDWGGVVDWYLQKTYRRTAANWEVRQKVRELLRTGMTEEEKVEAIYGFVTRDVKYSYVPFLNSSYTPKLPAETVSGSVGDCKDVATLAIAMLREAGIPAWHVLVSTHHFTEREPRPTLYAFNHAIAAWKSRVDGQLRFLDLTTDYFPSTTLPEMDNGGWCLLVRPGERALRRLPMDVFDAAKTGIEISGRAKINADRSISIETEAVMRGVAAGKLREELNPKTAAERTKWLADYLGGGSLTNIVIEKTAFDSLENLAAPLRMRLSLRALGQVDKVSTFHIAPLPLPLTLPARRELFAESRHNDLDLDELFELAPVRESVEVSLPEGWELMDVPADVSRSTEFGDYSLRFERLPGGGLRIEREMRWRRRFVGFEEYGRVKGFCLEVGDWDDTKVAVRMVGK